MMPMEQRENGLGWNVRLLDRNQLPGFRPYLLPGTAAALERGDENVIAIGAVTGRSACGAAAARLDGEGGARLTDLFVDEAVRRRGVGAFLLDQMLELLSGTGPLWDVTADYALNGEDLAAMDALMVKCGFSRPRLCARSFRAMSDDYRRHPVLRRSFDPRYRTPENVLSFDRLPREALDGLEQAEGIPPVLSWSGLKDRALPELSVALVRDGGVDAYLLAEESVDGGFVLLAAVTRPGGPASAFVTLLVELVNRCVYRAGGSFPFYFSTINDHAETLARKMMDGHCTEYEEHTCYFPLREANQYQYEF